MEGGRKGSPGRDRSGCRGRSGARRGRSTMRIRAGTNADLVDLRGAPSKTLRARPAPGEPRALGAGRRRRPQRPPSVAAPDVRRRTGQRHRGRRPASGDRQADSGDLRRCAARARPRGSGGGTRTRRAGRAGSPARPSSRHAGAAPGRAPRRAGPGCRGGPAAAQISSEGPISTMRPRYITAMRSATTRAAARSWVTKSTAMPSSRRSWPIRLRTVAASETSRALVGSSHRRTSGGHDRRPGQRRPLALTAGELRGLAPATSAGRPTRARASSTRAAPLARDVTPRSGAARR